VLFWICHGLVWLSVLPASPLTGQQSSATLVVLSCDPPSSWSAGCASSFVLTVGTRRMRTHSTVQAVFRSPPIAIYDRASGRSMVFVYGHGLELCRRAAVSGDLAVLLTCVWHVPVGSQRYAETADREKEILRLGTGVCTCCLLMGALSADWSGFASESCVDCGPVCVPIECGLGTAGLCAPILISHNGWETAGLCVCPLNCHCGLNTAGLCMCPLNCHCGLETASLCVSPLNCECGVETVKESGIETADLLAPIVKETGAETAGRCAPIV
jgi:hypothetical protein